MTRLEQIEKKVDVHPVMASYDDVVWLATRLRLMYTLYGDPDAPRPTGIIRHPDGKAQPKDKG